MYRFYFIISLILQLGCSQSQPDNKAVSSFLHQIHTDANVSYEEMTKGFHQIPNEVRMKSYWIWLNGQVTRESITSELEEMNEDFQ